MPSGSEVLQDQVQDPVGVEVGAVDDAGVVGRPQGGDLTRGVAAVAFLDVGEDLLEADIAAGSDQLGMTPSGPGPADAVR
ncbi:MAG: hypothetical protein U0800_06160 [Isosphaeraceae bacterium]